MLIFLSASTPWPTVEHWQFALGSFSSPMFLVILLPPHLPAPPPVDTTSPPPDNPAAPLGNILLLEPSVCSLIFGFGLSFSRVFWHGAGRAARHVKN